MAHGSQFFFATTPGSGGGGRARARAYICPRMTRRARRAVLMSVYYCDVSRHARSSTPWGMTCRIVVPERSAAVDRHSHQDGARR